MATVNTKFVIKQHDLAPDLVVSLLDGETAVDLTTASSVRFHMHNLLVGLKVDAPMTIDDAVNGQVSYAWAGTDTDTVATYNAEVEVMWPGGKPQTFPADGYFTVKVTNDLDD